MRLVILHTILLQLWVGIVRADEKRVLIHVFDKETKQKKFVEVSESEARIILNRQAQLVNARSFYIDPLLKRPITPEKIEIARKVADRAAKPVKNNEDVAAARRFFEETTEPLIRGGEKPEKVKEFVDSLVEMSREDEIGKKYFGERSQGLEELVRLTREAEATKAATDQSEASKAEIDAIKKERETEAKKQKEIEAQRKEQELKNQLEQQALAQALNQASQGNGRGGSGGGSGGNNNSSNNKSPELPKSETPQIKDNNFADQLAKVINQKNNTPDLSSLFNNNSNSSSSNKEKKDDAFKFDISPKTPKNDKIEPVKASVPNSDPSSPVNPTAAQNPEGALENFLSGPSSIPQLMAGSISDPFNPSAGGNAGGNQALSNGAGGANGFGGGIQGGIQGGNGSNASDIFSSVGQVDYGDRPPPIRKDSAAYGGEGGSGEGGSDAYGGANGSAQKKGTTSLLDELTLMSNNPRAKGRGIMAFVGFQVKDFCTKSSSKKMAICNTRNREKKERISLVTP